MIRLLSRWLIPDRDNVSSPAVRRAYGTLCGAASQFRLGLTLELGVGHPDADDRGEPFTAVGTLEGHVLEQVVGLAVVVERLRESGPESREVRSPFGREDGVDEGVDLLVVAVGPLHRDVDLDAVLLAVEAYGDGMNGRLGPVEVLDEL